MRSARLLELLLVLQTRNRVTTAELAALLEVSRRTVLRDVEALGAAGIPVYAERGRHGGIALLPGARLAVPHLEPAEIEALAAAGLDDRQIEDLGLGAARDAARRKLDSRLRRSEGMRPGLADLVLTDGRGWMQPGPTNGESSAGTAVDVAGLAVALRDRTRLRVQYRASGTPEARPLCVDPYGLASRAGRWYLVCDVDALPRLLRVDRIIRVEPLPYPARLRTGESLRTVWAELSAAVEAPGAVRIEARLRADRLDLAQRILGTRLRAEGRGEGGSTVGAVAPGDADTPGHAAWIPITVHYREPEGVRQLLQFGDHIEVLGPPEARARIARLAADLTRRHAEPLD